MLVVVVVVFWWWFHYCCCSTCPLAAAIGPSGVLLPSERERLAGRIVPRCSKDADIPTSWTFASTPLKFNMVPWKRNNPIRKALFQPSYFRGYVNFRGNKPLLCLFVLKNFSDNPLPHLKNDWWYSSWAVLVQTWNSMEIWHIDTLPTYDHFGLSIRQNFRNVNTLTTIAASITSPWPWDGKGVKAMYQAGYVSGKCFFRVMRTF